MKRLRLFAGFILAAFAFACFVSGPVFGENPWDADNSGNSDAGVGTHSDTTRLDDGMPDQFMLPGGQDIDCNWWMDLMLRLTYPVVAGCLADSQEAPAGQ